jgi:TRAP-type mannitol/chloroaromatic compound transport system permease large subunit
MFILIGSTVFSFTFNAADGHIWVEHLFKDMPGGAWGFLLVVNVLVFILGMFIDFFEIAFIVVPMLVPVAEKLLPALLPGVPVDAVMVWFGVIIAMNLQTSFLTPPFGFALFYLRSVAAKEDYNDRITKERIPAVTTAQIYKGSIAFICVQLIMVSVVVFYPKLVVGTLMDTAPKVDANKAFDDLLNADTQTREAAAPNMEGLGATPAPAGSAPAAGTPASEPAAGEKEDPMKGLLDAVKDDKKK